MFLAILLPISGVLQIPVILSRRDFDVVIANDARPEGKRLGDHFAQFFGRGQRHLNAVFIDQGLVDRALLPNPILSRVVKLRTSGTIAATHWATKPPVSLLRWCPRKL